MIHFFPTFSKDASNSPFAHELVAQSVEHKLLSGKVTLRYHSRIWLLLLGWPKVAWFGLFSAVRSLILSVPYPDAVVVGSHIEALIFGALRALRLRKKPAIILLGFILTARESSLMNSLRGLYFDFVFSIVDLAICHSTLEADRYNRRFAKARAKFVYMPYGLYVADRDKRADVADGARGRREFILAAGRSGRDYATLFAAVEALDIDMHVVCDSESALSGLRVPANVTILRNCYDDAYLDELRNALFVAIPLSVNDISAGQMVLIQAMAYAKPTIVTRTVTVEDYVRDGEQSLLVEQGNVAELRAAIARLLADRELARRLAASARTTFEQKFCMKVYVRNLVAIALAGAGARTTA